MTEEQFFKKLRPIREMTSFKALKNIVPDHRYSDIYKIYRQCDYFERTLKINIVKINMSRRDDRLTLTLEYGGNLIDVRPRQLQAFICNKQQENNPA